MRPSDLDRPPGLLLGESPAPSLPVGIDDRSITRFDGVERTVHWVTAILFLSLIATGAVLYIGSLSTLIGRRPLVRQLHIWAGLALPVPVLVGIAGRWGAQFRADMGNLNRWIADDRRWLRTRGRDESVLLGKFNPGQKLNASFLAGAGLTLLGTGAVMRWFDPFPVDWRTGATFVHDMTALIATFAVLGHIALGLSDRTALTAMLSGPVTVGWAAQHRPRWLDSLWRSFLSETERSSDFEPETEPETEPESSGTESSGTTARRR